MSLKTYLPTFFTYLEKRKTASKNRLPKHLRPPSLWPLGAQLLLNLANIVALLTLILNKDDYLSDAGPAITMIVCLLVTIYTFVEGYQLDRRHRKIRGRRLARLNWALSFFAFLTWAATVAVYLP